MPPLTVAIAHADLGVPALLVGGRGGETGDDDDEEELREDLA